MSHLTDAVLQKVSPERLQRAVDGLVSGAYAITLVTQKDEEICALVSNGDKARYEVVLTPERGYCGCGDSHFRGQVCKHQTALALYVLRTLPAVGPLQQQAPTAAASEAHPAVDLTLGKVRPGRAFAA